MPDSFAPLKSHSDGVQFDPFDACYYDPRVDMIWDSCTPGRALLPPNFLKASFVSERPRTRPSTPIDI
jgi:hypothetical protein